MQLATRLISRARCYGDRNRRTSHPAVCPGRRDRRQLRCAGIAAPARRSRDCRRALGVWRVRRRGGGTRPLPARQLRRPARTVPAVRRRDPVALSGGRSGGGGNWRRCGGAGQRPAHGNSGRGPRLGAASAGTARRRALLAAVGDHGSLGYCRSRSDVGARPSSPSGTRHWRGRRFLQPRDTCRFVSRRSRASRARRRHARLFAASGAWLGWAALPPILAGAAISGLVVAVLLWRREITATTRLPFGVFLAAVTWIVALAQFN